MTDRQKTWLARALAGGGVGAALYGGLYALAAADSGGFVSVLHLPLDRPALAGLAAFVLGAAVGIATLPFEETGRELAKRSAAHFALTAVLALLFNWAGVGLETLTALAVYAAIYAVVWGVRWVRWYFELSAVRKKLGLTGGKHQQEEEKT